MTTEFFTQIAPHLKPGLSMNMFFKDGRLTISILPLDKDGKHGISKPFKMEAALDEFNAGFFEELEKGLAEKVPAPGITSNAAEIAAEIHPPKKEKAKPQKKALKMPSKTKGTKMEWVKYWLSLDNIDEAQKVVDKARKGGGLPGKKCDELQKLVDKAKPKEEEKEKVVEPVAQVKQEEPLVIEEPTVYSDTDLAEFKTLVDAKINELTEEDKDNRTKEKEIDTKISSSEDINEINQLSNDLTAIRLKKLSCVKALADYRSRFSAINRKTFGIDSVSQKLIPKELLLENLLLTVNPNS